MGITVHQRIAIITGGANGIGRATAKQARGRIINAASIVGLYGNFGQTNYVATKSGVIGMTKVWARELGRHSITVNAVAPGFITAETNQLLSMVRC